MGILSSTVYIEYERELDRRILLKYKLDVYIKKIALDTVLARIQWGGYIAYGTIFQYPQPNITTQLLERLFDARVLGLMATLSLHEDILDFEDILSLVKKLKCRLLTQDEILAYELELRANRLFC